MIIEIKYVPKHAPSGSAVNSETFAAHSIQQARDYILRRRIWHQANSKWFEVWVDGKISLDSAYIHHTKMVKK